MNNYNSHTWLYYMEDCVPSLDQSFIQSLQLQQNFKGYSWYTAFYSDVCGAVFRSTQHQNCWKLFWKSEKTSAKKLDSAEILYKISSSE